MFLVEPMVARMVLPRLGGSPAVWSTCLLFFQGVLLLGYAYAHALTRLLPRFAQILVHTAIVLPLAALVLPLDFSIGAPPAGASPAPWLLMQLALLVGPPAFAISATAPLLQSWFAALDHDDAGNPYFLYAGSNAGSLLALLAYPMLVEPALPLDRQATLWSYAFGALALGIVLCAASTAIRGRKDENTLPRETAPPGSLRERLIWTALAFVPSSLLLGVTAYITKDIASVPLFWVVPLALYLLTFILTFARRPWLPHAAMARLLPHSIILLALFQASIIELPPLLLLTLHLGCFFVVCMVCHGELALRRPPPARLTEFYFFLSLGGVLGGAFNALLAPLIFANIWEYPLALVAACLVKPATIDDSRPGHTWGDFVLPLALLGLLLPGYLSYPAVLNELGAVAAKALICLCLVVSGMALLAFFPRRWRFALGVSVCIVAPLVAISGNIVSERSFFGVYHVRLVDNGQTRSLFNGSTIHGAESLLPGEERLPLTYYSPEGPFGRFFAALDSKSVRRVGVVGLGIGTLACYARSGQDWTFYEIDPLVERIARDDRFFHFLARCGNQPRVVIGDARLNVSDAPDGTYDVLVLDAFSSDSIPMHLITREAFALYLRKLAPGGRLLFHISSRTVDLRPVLAALAGDAGVPARLLYDQPPSGNFNFHRFPAVVVAVAGHGGDLDSLTPADGWTGLPAVDSSWLWTDQRSDILRVMRFKFGL